jgi:hypothetical protein
MNERPTMNGLAGHCLDLEQSAAPIERTLQAQAPEAGHSR